MSEGYHPEVDHSPLCTEDYSAKYRSKIDFCTWIIVLSRFDIAHAPSDMSRLNMLPTEGHLKAIKRILFFLKKFSKRRITIDTSYPDHFVYLDDDHSNWVEFNLDTGKEIPKDLPPKKGRGSG
jgi:hypothetical protein